MKPQWAKEFGEVLGQRATFYRMLASIYFKEVSEEFISRLDSLPLPGENDDPALHGAFKELKRYLVRRGPDPRCDLAVDYARVFLAAGAYESTAACPFESIYTSEDGLVMQEARDDVHRIYLKNGIDVNAQLRLPEDHLSFELEFMAIMSERAGALLDGDDADDAAVSTDVEKNLEAQRDFLERHILNWIGALEEKVTEVAVHGFYPAMMHITQAYAESDLLLLDEMLDVVHAGHETK